MSVAVRAAMCKWVAFGKLELGGCPGAQVVSYAKYNSSRAFVNFRDRGV